MLPAYSEERGWSAFVFALSPLWDYSSFRGQPVALLAFIVASALTNVLFVALAVINMQMMRSRIFRGPAVSSGVLPSNARTLAMASLFLWIGATTAGRLIAYI